MNVVGKILVVVQIVLSVMFMALAGAVFTAQQNWKEAAQSARDQATKVSNELSQIRQQFEQARDEHAAALQQARLDEAASAAVVPAGGRVAGSRGT